MALHGLFSPFLVTAPPRMAIPSSNAPKLCASKPVQCITTTDHDQGSASRTRRNANYVPSFWDYNVVKSLSSNYDVRTNTFTSQLINLTRKNALIRR